MLARGFTTVRDVGGGDIHMKRATAEWLIPGPRLVQGGPVMSQTGGHGGVSVPDSADSRGRGHGAVWRGGHKSDHPFPRGCSTQRGGRWRWGHGCRPPLTPVEACLKMARKIMMDGADHIKITSSGGVLSQTDRLESEQFRVDEIKAISDTVRMMVRQPRRAGFTCRAGRG